MTFASRHPQGHADPLDPQRQALKRRLRMELEAADIPHKALAIECDVDEALVSRWLSRWLSREQRDVPSTLHLAAITRELGPGFAAWLMARCGLELADHPAHHPAVADLHTLTALLAGSSGKAVQELIQDMADGMWTEDERRLALPGLRNLHTVVGALVRQAEAVQ